jgi:mediator of RNA polymerase II transcription subunit 6
MTEKQHLDELQWKSPEWIQAFGLRTDNVLEYFSESPFFDRTSNNQTVKMQSQFQEGYQANSMTIESELKKLVGVEFLILHRREPDFWIIRKQNRKGPDTVEPLADYFIIGANVYMAPTVKDVVSSRLVSILYSQLYRETHTNSFLTAKQRIVPKKCHQQASKSFAIHSFRWTHL